MQEAGLEWVTLRDVEKRLAAPSLVGSPELHGWKFDTPVTGAAFAGHVFSPGGARGGGSKRIHHAMHEQVEHFRLSDTSDEESGEEQAGKRVRRSGRGKDKAIASKEAEAEDRSTKKGLKIENLVRSKFSRPTYRINSKGPAGRLYGRRHCEVGNGEG